MLTKWATEVFICNGSCRKKIKSDYQVISLNVHTFTWFCNSSHVHVLVDTWRGNRKKKSTFPAKVCLYSTRSGVMIDVLGTGGFFDCRGPGSLITHSTISLVSCTIVPTSIQTANRYVSHITAAAFGRRFLCTTSVFADKCLCVYTPLSWEVKHVSIGYNYFYNCLGILKSNISHEKRKTRLLHFMKCDSVQYLFSNMTRIYSSCGKAGYTRSEIFSIPRGKTKELHVSEQGGIGSDNVWVIFECEYICGWFFIIERQGHDRWVYIQAVGQLVGRRGENIHMGICTHTRTHI